MHGKPGDRLTLKDLNLRQKIDCKNRFFSFSKSGRDFKNGFGKRDLGKNY